MDRRILGARQRIENLQVKAKTEPVSLDDELKAQIAQLLCVLSSGMLEESLRLTLGAFALRRSSPEVASYVTSRLADFQNPSFEKIMTLLNSFNPSWRSHFENEGSPETKDAINSIVYNRHQIAHGRQVGISIVAFGGYYTHMKKFIDDLDQLIAK